MNKDYIQNLRYKLQKRFRRLNSANYDIFHDRLQQFWHFLNHQNTLKSILELIESKVTNQISTQVQNFTSELQGLMAFKTEEQNITASYLIIKHCVEEGDDYSEIKIARRSRQVIKGHTEAVNAFIDIFVEPLYEYLDENLDDSSFILSLLGRYKQKVEWFQKKELYSLWETSTQRGEKLLAQNLYEYLFDQGIEFYIEPASISGEVDLIAAQSSPERLIADAKIFNPEKSKNDKYIIEGFRQVYQYTLDFNQPTGYLIIFKTCQSDIKFTFANESQSIPYTKHNNKTIFFLVLDLFIYTESASKRGKLKSYEITEDMLWEKID